MIKTIMTTLMGYYHRVQTKAGVTNVPSVHCVCCTGVTNLPLYIFFLPEAICPIYDYFAPLYQTISPFIHMNYDSYNCVFSGFINNRCACWNIYFNFMSFLLWCDPLLIYSDNKRSVIILTVSQSPYTVLTAGIFGRQMPAVRTVQGDCQWPPKNGGNNQQSCESAMLCD